MSRGIWFALCIASLATLSYGQTFTTLYSFSNSDGYLPGPLVQGRDGNLYGATQQGGVGVCSVGTSGCGTIFKLGTSGKLTTLHTFNPDKTEGYFPYGLTLVRDGNFYGTTISGGTYDLGVLFRVSPAGEFTILHHFTGGSDGKHPSNQLLEATDGNLYGLSWSGVYRYTPAGDLTNVYTFSPYNITNLVAKLLQTSDGSLVATITYGFYTGKTYPCGSILKMTLGGVILSEHNFGCYLYQNTGNFPYSSVIEAADGNFYGTNVGGGSDGRGTAFELNGKNGLFTLLHTFTTASEGPYAGVIQATDGNFYGLVQLSAIAYSGAIYQLTAAGDYTELVGLPYHGEDFPYNPLLQHTNGTFYGSIPWAQNQPGFYGYIFSFEYGLAPFIAFVRSQGHPGATAQILGQGLTGTSAVTFNGIAASSFSVVSDTYMTAVVPSGATTGPVVVTTPAGTLTSNVNFRISQ